MLIPVKKNAKKSLLQLRWCNEEKEIEVCVRVCNDRAKKGSVALISLSWICPQVTLANVSIQSTRQLNVWVSVQLEDDQMDLRWSERSVSLAAGRTKVSPFLLFWSSLDEIRKAGKSNIITRSQALFLSFSVLPFLSFCFFSFSFLLLLGRTCR